MGILAEQRQLAAVTGASSGIGLELARQFAKNGFDLVICAENAEIHRAAQELEAEGVRVRPVQVDLRTYDGVESFYAEIKRHTRPLDAIAINAGVGVNGEFATQTNLDEELALIQLNVISVVHLAKRVSADMVTRGSGRILITASVAANMPSPYMAVYGATKAFDLAFASSLRKELEDTGVTVTALIPGPTDTDFFARAEMEDTKAAENALDNDPADVARQGVEALLAGKDRVIGATSLATKLQGMTQRLVPEGVKAEQHRKLAEPGGRNK